MSFNTILNNTKINICQRQKLIFQHGYETFQKQLAGQPQEGAVGLGMNVGRFQINLFCHLRLQGSEIHPSGWDKNARMLVDASLNPLCFDHCSLAFGFPGSASFWPPCRVPEQHVLRQRNQNTRHAKMKSHSNVL